MNNELEKIFDRIKSGEIAHIDAAKMIKQLSIQLNKENQTIQNVVNVSPGVSEVYIYDEPYLRDHTINNEQVLPGVTYGSLALDEYIKKYPDQKSVHLHRLNFREPVIVGKEKRVEVSVHLQSTVGLASEFQILYRFADGNSWKKTADGSLHVGRMQQQDINIDFLKKRMNKYEPIMELYERNSKIKLGKSYRNVNEIYYDETQTLAQFTIKTANNQDTHKYNFHPLIINSAFSAVVPLISDYEIERGILPFGIKDIDLIVDNISENGWVLTKIIRNSGEILVFDAQLYNEKLQLMAKLTGCTFKILDSDKKNSKIKNAGNTDDESTENMNIDKTSLSNQIRNYLVSKLSDRVNDRKKLTKDKQNLMELGLESVALVSLTREIERDLNVELNPTLFFEFPNILELTKYFVNEFGNTFMEKLTNGNGFQLISKNEKTELINAEVQLSFNRETETNNGKSPISSEMDSETNDIAIIGMHGTFAEASDLDKFWDNLCTSRDVMGEIPLDHWDWRPWYNLNSKVENSTYCKWGSFISDVDKFDADFFNISPREAEWIDPQLRLLLQSIYMSSEDAGYAGKFRGTNTGVFVGVCWHDYMDKIIESGFKVNPFMGTGNSQTAIANRVSFIYDLKGPSLAIDTACSSSLIALHHACQALRKKECNLAFVGGVNLLLSSLHYRYFSSLGALSPTGRCHSFDSAADGYVPGECIASLLLKPLSTAERDGDRIHAVVKGSAALHGGHTPSITAPSVNGEENVITKAWEESRIDPQTLSYYEAHGTGTKLGDPIEIESLKKAFQRYTKKENFCAVGSVKANIGHTEGAAGIAGIIKVILQMKHKKIPPMAGFKTLNPFIQIDKSPLYINNETINWDAVDGKPRRAGVSSFGFSGAFSHAVIEEYVDNKAKQLFLKKNNDAWIITLSARNKDRLKERALQLYNYINDCKLTDENLDSVAYTLQTGREAMDVRMGMIIGSMEQLKIKLKLFVDCQTNIPDLYTGHVDRDWETVAIFSSDDELIDAVEKWIKRGKYDRLVDLWVKGWDFDWNRLYPQEHPQIMCLPFYPFARERYWVPVESSKAACHGKKVEKLHVLVHENVSNFTQFCFRSIFTGEEFFLRDHVVKGKKVLPGVVYLEMARVAIESASVTECSTGSVVRLRNVTWIQPLSVNDQSKEVQIGLYPDENGEINFEIYSLSDNNKEEEIVHCNGTVIIAGADGSELLDLDKLKSECCKYEINAEKCYSAYRHIGIEYGLSHQTIDLMYLGTDQIIAHLSLPPVLYDEFDTYTLHPSIMDAALQASIGFLIDCEDAATFGIKGNKPYLPFALEEIEILTKCEKSMWVWLKYNDERPGDGKIQKLDIYLCNDQGNISVKIKALSSRILEKEIESDFGNLIMYPQWEKKKIESVDSEKEIVKYIVMFLEMNKLSDLMKLKEPDNYVVNLTSSESEMNERYSSYALQVYNEIQKIFHNSIRNKLMVQLVMPWDEEALVFGGLIGIIRTAHQENVRITGQVIYTDKCEKAESLIDRIRSNRNNSGDTVVRYIEKEREVLKWVEDSSCKETDDESVWKEGGVYLIAGGLGGLGYLFAKEIVNNTKAANIILVGRSELNDEKMGKLKSIQNNSNSVRYEIADVANKMEVQNLIGKILKEYGKISGIINSAGIIKDNFIVKKTIEEFKMVMESKVHGTVNLDVLTKDIDLDFFIMFASGAGVWGNIGQADYATANAFMDGYSRYRNSLVKSGLRKGRTLSIDWPLWENGGMKVDKEVEKLLYDKTGMIPMKTQTGIRSFYRSIASARNQILVKDGNLKRIRQSEEIDEEKTEIKNYIEINNESDMTLKVKIKKYVTEIISKITKLPEDKISPDASFERYGVDSVIQLTIIQEFEKVTKSLPKTLLFEYSNVNELVNYFIKNNLREFTVSLQKKNQNYTDDNSNQKTDPLKVKIINEQKVKRDRFPLKLIKGKTNNERNDDVAIIGLSGRYPLSDNLEELWRNMSNGKNCITQATHDRFLRTLQIDPNEVEMPYGGFIKNINRFDQYLFDTTDSDALRLSPETRLFMETVWEMFEDSGYTKKSLRDFQNKSQRGVGVYVGTMYNQYQWTFPTVEQALLASNATEWNIANRTSYFFDLTGPSMAVNSACSSSMTAIHLACESLKQGTCSMAVAGGVNLTLQHAKFQSLQNARILGQGKSSRSFGIDTGYIPGEGVGAVLLKPLSAAIADNDRIYAIIKGSFVNHSGGRQAYTAPDPKSQTRLIDDSIKRSGIDPGTITYVEAAANGSELGDSIEIIAMSKAFESYTEKKQYCAIGSVKSNLGHLEAASGISQLSKVLLQMRYKTLVPSINSEPRNPSINLKNSAFYIQEKTESWNNIIDNERAKMLPLRCMINSFGAGGSYANIIIEEYIRNTESKRCEMPIGGQHLFLFSAKTENSLKLYINRMINYLNEKTDIDITDVSDSLIIMNHDFKCRAAIVAGSLKEIEDKLKKLIQTWDTNKDENIFLNIECNETKEGNSVIDEGTLKNNDLLLLADSWVSGKKSNIEKTDKRKKYPLCDFPKYAFDHTTVFNQEIMETKNEDEKCQEIYNNIINGMLSVEEFQNI